MTRKPSGPITLGRMPFFYTAAVLLVVLPIILGVAFMPVLQNYWCAQFEIPKSERDFGFTWGTLESTDPDGKRHSGFGITFVRPDGVFAKAGIRAGDIPRMQHGISSFCAALGAASDGYQSSLSVLNVEDYRAGRDTRRQITIDLASE